MNFRKLYSKLFGEDKELAEMEKRFVEGYPSAESSDDVSNNANEDVKALCKKLLDIKNEGIRKDQVTADMVPTIQSAADDGD